jgi:hypothetical protein
VQHELDDETTECSELLSREREEFPEEDGDEHRHGEPMQRVQAGTADEVKHPDEDKHLAGE